MTYLTKDEFDELGFDVDGDFDKLLKRAELAINAYIRDFYSRNSFDSDHEARKKAVKLATAYQVAYLDASGIATADDRQSASTVILGRTHISYQGGSKQAFESSRYNLSLDALNVLKAAGFGYRGVGYDRD